MPPVMRLGPGGNVAARATPPLHVMVDSFKRDLGVSGSSAKEVVGEACRSLGLDIRSLTIAQQAQQAYELIHGRGASAPAAGREADVPMGLPVTAEELAEEDQLSAALALSASLVDGAPPVVRQQDSSGSLTATEVARLAECPICFEDLCSEPCAVFVRADGRRVCTHALHQRCANELPSKCCPLCRSSFDTARQIPSIDSDPDGWFRCCDVDATGLLSRDQVLAVLLTQLPLDATRFEASLVQQWPALDLDRNGRLSRDEFFAAGGLLAFARRHLHNGMVRYAPGSEHDARGPIPDIAADRDSWFSYFDEDGRGLAQEEVVRGLIKTCQLGTDLEQVRHVRAIVAGVWGAFVSDGAPNITRTAFKASDGLADAIIAAMPTRDRLHRDRQMASALRAEMAAADAAAHEAERASEADVQLPDSIRACPACGLLMEKISGDDTMMCGCEARPAGGTYERALANGGCGHEFNFATLAPLGTGKPGEPANERQVRFRRR